MIAVSVRPAVARLFSRFTATITLAALMLSPAMAFGFENEILFARVTNEKPFPSGPEISMTPGSLCDQPDTYRYPEKIAYCRRNVDSEFKQQLIRNYDEIFGYVIQSLPRQLFKIDHFIPLCAGGSNRADNLWPQHETVYTITDPLEPLVCQRMAEGKLKQAEAVRLIRQAKTDLSTVDAVMAQLNSL